MKKDLLVEILDNCGLKYCFYKDESIVIETTETTVDIFHLIISKNINKLSANDLFRLSTTFTFGQVCYRVNGGIFLQGIYYADPEDYFRNF